MEQLQIIREIIMGFRSLITVTLFIFVLYLLFFLRYNKDLDSENKILLKSLAVTISFICFICTIKQFIPAYTQQAHPYLIAGNILQLYLPIQIYTLQRSYGYFSKLKDVIILSSGIFLLNIFLITASFYIGLEKLTVLQYLIQITIAAIIIFQYHTLSSAFKEIFNTYNKNSFSLKVDMFLFIISTIIVLLLSLSLFTNISPSRKEALKLILGMINIILLVKVLYYSSSERFYSLQTANLGTPSSPADNDFFNQKKDDDLKNRLLNYFETEKPYLNPRLTITEVALYLYSNKTYLSRLINDHYNNNFSQFVNYYRIQVAKELFLKDNRMTIHQLCDLSGFGSMATFTMAFRLNVGNSPAEWCKEQKIKRQNDNQEEEN